MVNLKLKKEWIIIIKYINILNVTASEVVKEQEKDYTPKGVSWSGVKYEPVDMIEDFLQNLIRNTDTYTEVYLDEELKKLVEYYKADSISLEEKTLPKRILGGVNMYPYEIYLVTDKYVYYAYYDNYMVFDINDYSILANNEFAENSYMESIENIKNGTEKKLWEYPTTKEKKEDMELRTIALTNGTSMGDEMLIFKTNAPVEELKKLEKQSCQVYLDGGSEEDLPIWTEVLSQKGYIFECVDLHKHITPYSSSETWMETDYSNVTEHYVIDNQPHI